MRARNNLAALLLAAVLAGCTIFTPTADRSRFFMLTPIATVAGAPFAGSVGLGGVTLPPHLDRPEIVTRVSPNEIRRATFDYWAETFADQFKATLAQDLQALLGGGPVAIYPWYAAAAPDVVVEVDVQSFERATDGQAHLVAHWRIRRGSARKSVATGDFDRARPLGGSTPEDTAAALSALLGDLGGELASAIRSRAS